MEDRFYTVDRITQGTAVLVDDTGRAHSVPLSEFRGGIAETMVLRVLVSESEEPDWSSAQVDMPETERRARRSARFLRQLQDHDPGGDVPT